MFMSNEVDVNSKTVLVFGFLDFNRDLCSNTGKSSYTGNAEFLVIF